MIYAHFIQLINIIIILSSRYYRVILSNFFRHETIVE